MATRKTQAQVQAEKARVITAEEFAQGWDSERRVHELKDLQVSVRDTALYVPAKTKSEFETTFGGPVTAIKYRTFEDFRVWLTPCKPDDPDARAIVPTTDTQSAGQVAFAIPLRKLGVKVPLTRTYNFTLTPIPVEGGSTVYEMSFKDFENERRDVDAEAAAAIKKVKAEQAKAKRAQKRAERVAKAAGSTSTGTTNP